MNFRRGMAREEPEINLIPFIDVLLVILIFLMVTTTYSRFTALQVTLPTAEAEKAQQRRGQYPVAPQVQCSLDDQGQRQQRGDKQKPDRPAGSLNNGEQKTLLVVWGKLLDAGM